MRSSRDVARVLRRGTPHGSERVVVYVASGDGPPRAALVAGRRAGGAVARNRARRLLREAWWALAPRIRDGHELVLMARGSLEGAKAHDVIDEIEAALRRAGVMRA